MNRPPLPFGPRPSSVSVVVPTHDRAEVLEQTLVLLLAQDWPAERLEVLVCDSSTDATPLVVERLAANSEVRLRRLPVDSTRAAVKRNRGVRAATGELVIILDDDIWVRPDFVRRHVEAHRCWTDPVAVVGLVEQSPRMPADPFVTWFRPFPFDQIADSAGKPVPFWFHRAVNLSMPRQVVLERNLVFHEDWTVDGHDDVELGYRWAAAGYRTVFEPDAWGEHFDPCDLAAACDQRAGLGRSLRDLEALVADPDLLEHHGVFSWRSSPRSVVAGLARRALVNRATAPSLLARLERSTRRRRWVEWGYGEVLRHHTEVGYRSAAPRAIAAATTISPTPAPAAAVVIHLSPPESDVVIDLRDRLPDDDVLDVVFAI